MKKIVKIICIISVIIVILGIVFFAVDYNRVQNGKRPIFCIKCSGLLDGGTVEFIGIGYKVIDFHTLAGFDDIKIGSWSMDYNDFEDEMKTYEDSFKERLNNANLYYANIKKISEYNGITSVLIEGLTTNDINHQGEFIFSIDNDTELLWNESQIKLSDLKEGQNVVVFSTGAVFESYPGQLTKVTKVIVLDKTI